MGLRDAPTAQTFRRVANDVGMSGRYLSSSKLRLCTHHRAFVGRASATSKNRPGPGGRARVRRGGAHLGICRGCRQKKSGRWGASARTNSNAQGPGAEPCYAKPCIPASRSRERLASLLRVGDRTLPTARRDARRQVLSLRLEQANADFMPATEYRRWSGEESGRARAGAPTAGHRDWGTAGWPRSRCCPLLGRLSVNCKSNTVCSP